MPAVWEDRNFRTSESKLRSQQNGKSKCMEYLMLACLRNLGNGRRTARNTWGCPERYHMLTLAINSYYQKWGMAFANIQEWWPQPDPYAQHDLWADKISHAQTCRLAVGQYSHWGQLMSNAGEPKGLRMERLSQTCDANTTLETQPRCIAHGIMW